MILKMNPVAQEHLHKLFCCLFNVKNIAPLNAIVSVTFLVYRYCTAPSCGYCSV